MYAQNDILCPMKKHWTIEYLGQVLEQRDWSMARLAREAGVSASTINRPMREANWSFALHPGTVAKIHAASGIDPRDFMPRDMEEPPEMFRASTDTVAAQVLRNLDKPPVAEPDEGRPNAQARNEIKIAVVGDLAQIVATVDRAGLAKLRAKLDAIDAMLDD
jgi:transcriptional regulator with XRE-family HTH domain